MNADFATIFGALFGTMAGRNRLGKTAAMRIPVLLVLILEGPGMVVRPSRELLSALEWREKRTMKSKYKKYKCFPFFISAFFVFLSLAHFGTAPFQVLSKGLLWAQESQEQKSQENVEQDQQETEPQEKAESEKEIPESKAEQKKEAPPEILDVVTFKNGKQLSGRLIAITFSSFLFRAHNGKVKSYPKTVLARLCFGKTYRKCTMQTGWDRLWRSALLPGWGQWAGRSYASALIFGGLFVGLSMGALHFDGLAKDHASDAKKAIEESNQIHEIGPRVLPDRDSSEIEQSKKESEEASDMRDAFWAGTAFIYLLQLYHAYNNGFLPSSEEVQGKKLTRSLQNKGERSQGFFFSLGPADSSYSSTRQASAVSLPWGSSGPRQFNWAYRLNY